MAAHRKVTAALLPLFFASASYSHLRTKELDRLHVQADLLSTRGWIEVPSVGTKEKEAAWRSLWPVLAAHYSEKFPNFSVPHGRWPRPADGKSHSMTCPQKVPDQPLLITSSYPVQSLTSYLISPTLGLVHFGSSTHWKLKLMVRPLWLLADAFEPEGMVEMRGEDQGWHIPSFPRGGGGREEAKKKEGEGGRTEQKGGGPKPNNSHFDGGRNNCYSRGIPLSEEESEKEKGTRRTMRFLLRQLGVLFYSGTPGEVRAEHGATGFFEGSHLVALAGISALSDDPSFPSSIPHPLHTSSIRSLYSPLSPSSFSTLTQPTLSPPQALFALGPLVHTASWSDELMRGDGGEEEEGRVRVIQNCKVHVPAGLAEWSTVTSLLDRVSPDSHLARLAGVGGKTGIEWFGEGGGGGRERMREAAREYGRGVRDAMEKEGRGREGGEGEGRVDKEKGRGRTAGKQINATS